MTTITSLLCPKSTTATAFLRSALDRASVVSKLAAAATGMPDPLGALAGALKELLDTSLGDLVDTAWSDQQQVRDAMAKTNGSIDASVAVPLVEQRLTITDTIRVEVAGMEQKELEPTLTVTVDIASATVTVHNGHLERVTPTRATATAVLTLGSDVRVAGSPKTVELPGSVHLRSEPDQHALPRVSRAPSATMSDA